MKKKLRKFLSVTTLTFVFICLTGFLNTYGASPSPSGTEQQKSKVLTGKVTDDTGQTVPGASIVLKGTTTGTITDMNGGFSLSVPSDAKTLVISFVGMVTQEVVIGTKTTINVTLVQETIGLNEVVAIGYGTVRKKDLTGSVSSVNSSKLQERAAFSSAQALQGKAAGVVVQQTNSAPGADANVMIRGNRSLLATNSPLYVGCNLKHYQIE
jgi:hypothetical protein